MERVESEADYDESCPQSTESKRIPSATTGQGEEDAGIERCRESIIMPSRPEEVRWSVQEYSQTPLFRVPLDFMIPDVYRQQLHDESVVEDSNIPILDLACFQECTDAHVQTIRLTEHMVSRACEEYGVFQVINHGISDITLDSTLELARKFFDLPMAEKMKYKIDGVEGYGGWNSARFRDWGDNLTHVINVCKQPYASGLPDRPERYRVNSLPLTSRGSHAVQPNDPPLRQEYHAAEHPAAAIDLPCTCPGLQALPAGASHAHAGHRRAKLWGRCQRRGGRHSRLQRRPADILLPAVPPAQLSPGLRPAHGERGLELRPPERRSGPPDPQGQPMGRREARPQRARGLRRRSPQGHRPELRGAVQERYASSCGPREFGAFGHRLDLWFLLRGLLFSHELLWTSLWDLNLSS